MSELHEIQQRAWRNKLRKGFSTDNVPMEFALAFTELGEAFDAYRRTPETLGSELADVIIYITCIAEMTGVDLSVAVADKLSANERRTYTRNGAGTLIKRDAS